MGASLRTGLIASSVTGEADPVRGDGWSTCRTSRLPWYDGWLDLPDAADVLARATYDGRPGHPVLLGRDPLGRAC